MAPYKCLSNITCLLCHHLQPSSCPISAVGMVFSFSSSVNLSQVLYMTAREILINRKPILPFPCLNPAVPLLNPQLKTKGRGGTQTLVIRSCSLLRTTAPLPQNPHPSHQPTGPVLLTLQHSVTWPRNSPLNAPVCLDPDSIYSPRDNY